MTKYTSQYSALYNMHDASIKIKTYEVQQFMNSNYRQAIQETPRPYRCESQADFMRMENASGRTHNSLTSALVFLLQAESIIFIPYITAGRSIKGCLNLMISRLGNGGLGYLETVTSPDSPLIPLFRKEKNNNYLKKYLMGNIRLIRKISLTSS